MARQEEEKKVDRLTAEEMTQELTRKREQDNIRDSFFEDFTKLENLCSALRNGVETIDMLANGYFQDGTESAWKKAIYGPEEIFRRYSDAFLFATSALTRLLDDLSAAIDEFSYWRPPLKQD